MTKNAHGQASSAQEPVIIFGTGAMAMLVGARLARSGAEVILTGSWEEGLLALNRNGIRVLEGQTSWTQQVGVSTLTGLRLPRAESRPLSIVLVKSHQTAAIAPAAARAGGTILTLQNGLGNAELLQDAAGFSSIVAGISTRGATNLGPGKVRDAGGGATILPSTQSWIADLFEKAGFEVQRVSDIRAAIWLKLAINCAINPVTALLGLPNGSILESASSRDLAMQAAREVDRVARSQGIQLDRDPASETLRIARCTASNRSSMLQDLDRGLPTEIDAMCGEVVRRGTLAGIATPVNEKLWREIEQHERREVIA